MIDLKFFHFGDWRYADGRLQLPAKLSVAQETGIAAWLYVFKLPDRVLYVGETEQQLRVRLELYRSGHTGTTNVHKRELLTEATLAGWRIRIEASPAPEDTNLRRDLEREMVERFDPPWNYRAGLPGRIKGYGPSLVAPSAVQRR